MANKHKIAFLFPGQGSQKVGMGRNLFENHVVAKNVFKEVDEILKFNLSRVIFEGSELELKQTRNTQPALMAVSIAIVRVIEFETKKQFCELAEVICGHSLGEYTALCSVRCISLSDTAKLLRLRGESMEKSVIHEKTKMSAILGLNFDKVQKIIDEDDHAGICEIANDNSPGQIVLSGHSDKVEIISKKCLDYGAKRSIDLNVSAPFHCSLMKNVGEIMGLAFKEICFKNFDSKFINNYSAKFVKDIQEIKNLLIKQISSKVRWRESIIHISNTGVQNFIEVGSGKVLTGLNKRMNLDIKGSNIETMSDIDFFLENYCK